jgi:hypothetical protein
VHSPSFADELAGGIINQQDAGTIGGAIREKSFFSIKFHNDSDND